MDRISMKIAYLYDAVYPWVKGGAEKRIYELSRRLASRGHEVHCYGMKWWEGEKDICREGVHLHGICRPMPLYSGGRRSMREAAYFATQVLSSLDRDFDLVDCQEFPYIHCFSAKLLCSLKRQELFITWLEVWGNYWHDYLGYKGLLGKWVEMATARLTDKNVAISERTRRDLEGLGIKGVELVPSGVDFREIEMVKPSGYESDVIYVGRLVEHKNVDLLIKTLSLIRKEVPDLRSVVIGHGPEMGNLTTLVHQLGLEKHIEFTGFLENYDDALALMKSSRLFISPSIREGFGMAALEANACGLPIVTIKHRMNAVSDLVTEGTGWVCDPSEEALAATIQEGLKVGKGLRSECKNLAKGYDWERICDLAEKVYS